MTETGDRTPFVFIVSSKPDFLLDFPFLTGSDCNLSHIRQCESIPEALELALVAQPDRQSPYSSQCILFDWELSEFSHLDSAVETSAIEKGKIFQQVFHQLNQQLIKASQNFVPVLILIEAKHKEILAPLHLDCHLDYLLKESLTQEFLNFALNQAITKANLSQKLAETEQKLQKYELRKKRNKWNKVKSIKFQNKFQNKFISSYKFHAQILAQVSEAVIFIDHEYRVIYCNEAALKQYKLPSDRMLGKYLSECYEIKWLKPEDEHTAKSAIQTQGYWQGINIHCLLNGEELFVESNVISLKDEDGNSIGLLATNRNITERKLAEQYLKESEIKLRKLTDHIPVALYQFLLKSDGTMSFPYMSQGSYSLFGVAPEVIQSDSKAIFSLVHPLDLEPLYYSIQTSTQTLEPWRWEGRICTISGHLKWISGISQPELLPNGDILWHGMARDISDRKATEIALQQSEATNQIIIRAIPDLLLRLSPDGNVLACIQPSIQSHKFLPISQHISEVLPPDLVTRQLQAIEQAISTGELQVYEHHFFKYHQLVYEEVRIVAINDQEVFAIVRDISDWIESQSQLEKNSRLLPGAIYQFRLRPDGSAHFPYASERMLNIYGVTPEQLKEDASPIFNMIHPDDIQDLHQSIISSSANLTLWHQEYRICLPDRVRWLAASSTPELDPDGSTIWHGYVEDISELKSVELNLKRVFAELNHHIENSPLATIRWNSEFRVDYWSKQAEQIFGWRSEEVLGKNFYDWQFIYEDDLEHVEQVAAKILSGAHQTCQNWNYCKDGTLIYCEWHNSVMIDRDGNLISMFSLVENVTKRKKKELELLANRDFQKLLFTQANDALFVVNVDTSRTVDCNQRAVELFEANSKADLIDIEGHILQKRQCTPDETREMKQEVEQNGFWRLEVEFITLKGREFWGNLSAKRITFEDRCFNLVRVVDISDRKLVELDLLHNQKVLYETAQILQHQMERQNLTMKITQQIYQSLNLDRILTTSVHEIKRLLNGDRVIIFQFKDGVTKVVKESINSEYPSIIDIDAVNEYFTIESLNYYINLNPNFKIYASNVFPEEVYEQLGIKSQIITPIVQYKEISEINTSKNQGQLWGLLIVQTCDDSRSWQPEEIDLMEQIANQLAIAIQQASLYEQVQNELSIRQQFERQLMNELNQKKVLLKEIHHRVKNNLQVMSSISYMQFRHSSPEIKKMSEEYQNRIQSMALIHEQLYRSNDLANIDFHNYILDLTRNLFECYGANADFIKLNLEVKNIFLPLDRSIPLGLIINELVSNALKHAFPRHYGAITIKFIQLESQLQLTISDNGVGLPINFNPQNLNSMGFFLISSLVEELEGDMVYESKNGLTFTITFPISS